MTAAANEQAWPDRDHTEITQLLHQFSRAVDRKRWADIPHLTTEDALFDYGIFKGSVAELLAWMQARHEQVERSCHLLGSTMVEVSGQSALCETYIISSQRVANPAAASGAMDVLTMGRYIDVFIKDDNWRLARRHFVVDNSTMTEAVPGSAGAMNLGRRDETDILWTERTRLGIT